MLKATQPIHQHRDVAWDTGMEGNTGSFSESYSQAEAGQCEGDASVLESSFDDSHTGSFEADWEEGDTGILESTFDDTQAQVGTSFNVDHQEGDSCVDVELTELRGLLPSPEQLLLPDSPLTEAGPSSLSAALYVERMHRILLEEELKNTRAQLQALENSEKYCRQIYSASTLSDEVLRMETGLPDRETFLFVVEYVARFQSSDTYFRD